MDEKTIQKNIQNHENIELAIARRRELADRSVSNVVSLLERRQDLRGIYPMADLLADNVGWVV